MRKRRKMLIILALLALISIVLFALGRKPSRPLDEPQYQGRYLSEWLGDPRVFFPNVESADEGGKNAVRAIGTNGLPYYLEWMHYEPSETRIAVSKKLPQWIKLNHTVSNWIDDPAWWHSGYGFRGFEILGTNAVSAIPELTIMLNDTSKPYTSQRAVGVLCVIGPQGIPVLRAALADTNRVDRWKLASVIRALGHRGYSNTCLPILAESLYDHEAEVRKEARLALEKWAPHLLTNAPAN